MKTRSRGRRFLSTVVVPLVGGLALTFAGLHGLSVMTGVPLPDFTGQESTKGETPEIVTAVAEHVAPASRDVTPVGVTPGPLIPGPLPRVAAGPATGEGRIKPETTFRRVVVIDGSHFRTIRAKQPVVVRLAGIRAPAFQETCTDQSGKIWKCGARARAELSRLIRNRSVACVVVDDENPAELVARCRIGARDISEWMAEGGWADPEEAAPAPVQDAAAAARRAKKGRFGPAPSGIIAG